MRPPLWVTHEEKAFQRHLETVDHQEWHWVDGFTLPEEPFDLTTSRTVCIGVVADPEATEAALVAALRGAGVIALITLADPLSEAWLAGQLMRIFGGETPVATAAQSAQGANGIIPDCGTSQLLDRLGAGMPIREAASACAMSYRTAHRRLVAARAHYGVATSLEAVLAHRRLTRKAAGEALRGVETRNPA